MSDKKLCSIAKKGLKKGDLEDYKKLVNKAKHVCKKCGRVSNKSGHVCKPDKI